MSTVRAKLNLLEEVIEEDEVLSRMLDKLVQISLAQHQTRLERYKDDLSRFEARYKMSSADFYEKFERGELGDDMDFFEWAGLYELYQDLSEKVNRLKVAR